MDLKGDRRVKGGLVLTMRLGEVIVVDDGRIVLQVVRLRGSEAPEVRLLFQADRSITFEREKVYEARTGKRIERFGDA
jgi:sRNA-binding carbon storage regulator CsrA